MGHFVSPIMIRKSNKKDYLRKSQVVSKRRGQDSNLRTSYPVTGLANPPFDHSATSPSDGTATPIGSAVHYAANSKRSSAPCKTGRSGEPAGRARSTGPLRSRFGWGSRTDWFLLKLSGREFSEPLRIQPEQLVVERHHAPHIDVPVKILLRTTPCGLRHSFAERTILEQGRKAGGE